MVRLRAPHPPHRNRGVAVIVAMLVVALATAAVTAMVSRQQIEIRRTANLLEQDQAYLYGLAVETWGEEILRKDHAKSAVDDLTENWAQLPPPIPVEGGSLAGRIIDLQGRFNLNNLVVNGLESQPDAARFRRLLELLGLDPDLVQSVLDWIDPDMQARFPGGAEDDYYLRLSPPYRAANQAMTSPTELILVAGYTPKIYQALAPFITALPGHTPINVNTAPALVLAMLVPGLSADDAKALVQARAQQPYKTVQDFLNQPAIQARLRQNPQLQATLTQGISVSSNYFLIHSETQVGRARVFLNSVILRGNQGNEEVIMRTRGTV
ncbi:MAG: hypothetical protein B7Z66_03540 [Chromatiales bacterium 21-64-14]|nr:MAG: hypothetical protein B7Z66_03540 [Chromatiales bacterium 21-64-14]HQU14849.1 type II secretion system minor pseudopilin GspK [Gammaproteobacteria bacterium]